MSAEHDFAVAEPLAVPAPANAPLRPELTLAHAAPAAPVYQPARTARPQALPARTATDVAIRTLDILAGLAGLVLAAPILAALAIMIGRDGGQVFFAQTRVGRGNRHFACYKLRSMAADAEARLDAVLAADPEAAAEWRETRKLKNDPRVTPLGALIRKTSLDELPQLWNILKGDMSLVGPRPVVPDELPLYGGGARAYLSVRPGLTGLWQVSGRNDCDYGRRIALDAEWARTRSVSRYLEVVLRTVPTVIAKSGAY